MTGYDVTVAGAGPVGLMLAGELALAGVKVQVIERQAEPDEAMKAQSINIPTAAALDRRGLLPAAMEVQRGALERIGSFGGRSGDTRFTGHFAGMILNADLVDWEDPDITAHSTAGGARIVPQRELEALLTEHLTRLGVPVRRGVEVTAVDDIGDGVLVGTTAGRLRTGWLVGCDGGHSAVRRLAVIEFPGAPMELTGYQAVVDIADPDKLTDGWVWSAAGAYRCGPQPGRIVTLEFGDRPADRSEPVTLGELQTSLRRVSGTDVTLTALRAAATRWTDNTRQAATYRSGRVLLAGDAAHVHPPFGGQGLNLGIGDAINLGWKLGAVITGWAPAGLLDTYDAERRPAGARVLEWTRAQIAVLRGDAKSAALRGIVADLLGTRDGTTYAVKKISGVDQRIELPGDAAHVHPPFGGQGLNLGIGDAINLGWKLGAVITGWAPAGLLDTYDAERRPAGARVLEWTRAQIAVLRGDAKSAALRGIVADLLGTRDGTTYAVKKISGVDQRIELPRTHPLIGRYLPDLWLRDGTRLADHGHAGGFLLLDRTPDGVFARLAGLWGDRVHITADDPASPAGVLVRPDGVVAWAADTADAAGLQAALRQWAGQPKSADRLTSRHCS